MTNGINVYSEIGKLNRVLLHRLGREIEGLVRTTIERLLFDEIPYLKWRSTSMTDLQRWLREK